MKPAAGLSIIVAAMLVSLALLSPSGALADELPKDTNQIESLTTEQTKTLLAEFKGQQLDLNGLTTLDADTVKGLAEFKGHTLQLNGLTTLDADIAKTLAEFKGRYLYLNGLTTLNAATAKAIAEFKGPSLELSGLTTLDAATAKPLAEFRGFILLLNGLTAIDAGTATALAEFKGQYLYLNGLTTFDAGTAKVLAEFKGEQLLLNGLTTLDADTAKALAESKPWGGQLPRITAFESPDSVEIAAALAKRKGPLLLRSLTKISPKTLTALIEKEDVEIPLIETLELIQEPDGSLTEDFVIPKGFQAWQKVRQQGR